MLEGRVDPWNTKQMIRNFNWVYLTKFAGLSEVSHISEWKCSLRLWNNVVLNIWSERSIRQSFYCTSICWIIFKLHFKYVLLSNLAINLIIYGNMLKWLKSNFINRDNLQHSLQLISVMVFSFGLRITL